MSLTRSDGRVRHACATSVLHSPVMPGYLLADRHKSWRVLWKFRSVCFLYHEREERFMENNSATDKATEMRSSPDVVANWMFSLLPIGVAFVFYVVFISATNLENTNIFIAYGAAAAFVGLETYWIMYGVRKKYFGTVLMGLVGVALTLGLLYLYLSIAG